MPSETTSTTRVFISQSPDHACITVPVPVPDSVKINVERKKERKKKQEK